MPQDQQTYKRAAVAALVGFFTQLVLAICLALVGIYAQSPAIQAATLHFFGGLPIWLVLWVLFRQHQLERAEALEAEALARADARTAAIFDEAGQQLQLARKRLENLNRWWLPIVSLLVALYLVGVGVGLLYTNSQSWQTGQLASNALNARAAGNLGILTIVLVCIGFVAFLTARYVAGMTRIREWARLRGGASYLMGDVVLVALLFIGVLAAWLGNTTVMAVFALVIPGVMALLGVEMLLGLLLRIYRPRRPGQVDRPAFDSRILGWLTRPESLGKIIGEAINYQFGFEISASWFYRLVAKAVVPLVIIAAIVLFGLTSIVIVAPHQEAVVTHFGRFERIAKPGLSYKWPWPIDQATRYDVTRVQQIKVGSEVGDLKPEAALLWTNDHSAAAEHYLLTAPSRVGAGPGEPSADESQSLAGELIGAGIDIKYRIDDLAKYATSAIDPVKMLKALAVRQINRYFLTHDVEDLLARNRVEAGGVLRQAIQNDIDAPGHELGIKIVFVGLEEIHPPQEQEVAASFHDQIDARQEAQATIQDALKDAISTLAEVAGSRDMAVKIDQAIAAIEQMRQQLRDMTGTASSDSQASQALEKKIAQQGVVIEKLMDEAGGKAAQLIYQARAYRWQHALTGRARAMRVESEYQAYREAPEYFRKRMYLQTLADGLKDRRKTVIVGKKTGVNNVRVKLDQQNSEFGSLFNNNNTSNQ